MPIAFNPSDGSAVYYDPDAATWVPAQVARNEGGDSVAFDGSSWVPLPKMEPKGPQPAASIGEAVSQVMNDPTPGSLFGLPKAIYEGVTTPGRVLSGEFNVKPEVPGQWSEADEFRAQQSAAQLQSGANAVAGLAIPGQLPRVAAPNAVTQVAAKPPVPVPDAAGRLRLNGRFASATPKPAAPVIDDPLLRSAENIGVSIPRVLATESVPVQRAGSAISQIPLSGEPIVSAVRSTVDDLGQAATRVSERLGAGSPEIAGAAAARDLNQWARVASRNVEGAAHNAVQGLVNPAVEGQLTNTLQAVSGINARRANAALGETPISEMLNEALGRTGMNYQGVKDLRSMFGPKAKYSLTQRGVDYGEAKQVYAALTKDLENVIRQSGGDRAVSAWRDANAATIKTVAEQKKIARIIGDKADVPAEQVFERIAAMASSRQRADLKGLVLAKQKSSPETWNEIASAVLSRMGRDAEGNFSPERFLGPNGYNRLSDNAKKLLFSKKHKQALDDIAAVSNAIKDKVSAFENRSRTGGTVIGAAGMGGILVDPVTTLGTFLGGRVLAEYLARPATAKAAAEFVRAQARVIERSSPAAELLLQAATRNLLAAGAAAGIRQEMQPVR